MRVSRIMVLSALILGLGAKAMADIPFLWLDAPKGRDNKFDPKSPLFVPTNTPGTTSQYDAKDPGDNSLSGGTALTGSSTPGSPSYDNSHYIGYGSDNNDFFTMTLTVGQTYDFSAIRTSGSSNMTIEVQNGSGTVIAGPVTGSNPSVSYVAVLGTVYVRVSMSGSVNGYDFKYQNTSGATPTPTLTNTPIPPTNTYTVTNTPTRTNTPTVTNTVGGPTNTFTLTATQTPTATATNTLGGPTNTFTQTPTQTLTPTNTPPGSCNAFCMGCTKFEDFEGVPMGQFTYQDAGSSAAVAQTTTAEAHSCTASLAVQLALGATAPYAAVGFDSSYAAPGPPIALSVPGATYIKVWIKSAAAVQFAINWKENSGTAAQDESWTSPSLSYTTPGSWQEIAVALNTFTENVYNGSCTPNCLTTNNNTMDLNVVGPVDLNFTTANFNGTVYVDDLAFDYVAAPTPTNTPAACAAACSGCIVWENFEAATGGLYYYADTGGGASNPVAAQTNAESHSCTGSLGITLAMGGGAYAGLGFNSPNAAGTPPVVNAAGANYIRLWMKASANQTFVVTVKEANVAGADPSNEAWSSGTMIYNTPGAWQEIFVNIANMTENPYNGDCAPSCASGGNNTIDKAVMSNFELQFTTPSFNGTVYVDDVSYDPVTVPTATPTPASPGVDFDDYEDGVAAGSYTYNDGACTMSFLVTNAAAHTGSYGFEITTDTTGTPFAYGAGAGNTCKGPATFVDATGLNNVSFWISTQGTGVATVNYAISIKEDNGSAALNENWTASAPGSTVGAGWTQVIIPFASFAENIYNPDCTPNCGTMGDNTMNLSKLAVFDYQITTPGFAGTVYIDDIRFQ